MLGHGQVDTRSRSGQNRSNFNVGISEKNWCLSDSVFFYSEFIGAIFISVGGPHNLQKWIKQLVYTILVVFWTIWVSDIMGFHQNLVCA